MRKLTIYFIVLLLVSGITNSIIAQISKGGKPASFVYNKSDTNVEIREVPKLSEDEINTLIENSDKNGSFYKIGKSIPVNVNIDNSGTWEELPDGSKLWRLKLFSENAQAIGVYYNDFYIPKGGKLFLYNKAKTQVIGAFTEENNPENGIFATEMIQGDEVCLEYLQPVNCVGKPIIDITEISYIFRDAHFSTSSFKDFGDADNCEVNVNCSEGANWQDQKQGVVRILVYVDGTMGWCSGSLINNTSHDCSPYILTADHCGHDATVNELSLWYFYFNYEAPTCDNPTSEGTLASKTMTGCYRIASGGNNGDTGSDFYLVRLTSDIPTNYNAYFNGWNRQNAAAVSGVCIQHPAGDIKKISTFTTTPITSGWNGSPYQSHWEVTWSSTINGFGVTEGGSSGSPLFDQNKRIVGTSTGGASYCTSPTSPDYFGKFSYSWDMNGTSDTEKLAPFLDPVSSGIIYLNGEYCGSPSIDPPLLRGTVFNDINGNGVQDIGENGLVSKIIPFKVLSDNYTYFVTTDSLGNYYNYAPTYGDIEISYVPDLYWNLSSDSISFTIPLVQLHDTIGNLNFGVKAQPGINDLSVYATSDGTRCGTIRNHWINYKNVGTTIQNGTIEYKFDTLISYDSSTPEPDLINGNILSWNFNNLDVGEQRQVHIYFQMPDFNFMGDSLTSYVKINPLVGDSDVLNNFDTLRQVIVCSYDPNDKSVFPEGLYGEKYVLFNQDLAYTIRFQNTGNDTAYTVIIKDTLSNNLDVSTFSILATSHPVSFNIDGTGIVTFVFENIMLPDSNVNDPGSNGFVKFHIEPNSGLAENTVVHNTAYIYFDENPPVITNEVKNTYVSSIPDPCSTFNVTLTTLNSHYPPGNNGAINIEPFGGTAPYEYIWSNGSVSSNISGLAPGNYCLTATDLEGCNFISCVEIVQDTSQGTLLVDSTTQIQVCFTATHTYVSDLGFYLLAPGYGPGQANPSIPGETGTVELAPAVSAWDDGITYLPASVYGCIDPMDIGTNCNGGNNVSNLCFTTSLTYGMPSLTACFCDMAVPLTGSYASAGTWANVYGFPINNGGWSVQVYDCGAQDIGSLLSIQITFNHDNYVYEYNSGTISEAINDNLCDYTTATTYTFPETTVAFNQINITKNNVLIYPNPATDELFIEFSSSQPQTSSFRQYRIYGIEGKNVKEGKLEGTKSLISTKDLESGVYFIEVNYCGQKMNSKLVITN